MSGTEQYEKQRRHEYHTGNLNGSGNDQSEGAEVLEALSEVNDLPIDPKSDEVLGQLVSKLASTANLSKEQVRSNEWVREYILVLYLCKFPTEEGLHGSWRGWAHGDGEKARDPLDPEKRMMIESYVSNSKLALSRSEEAKVIEESIRNVSESIVNDGEEQGSSSGGLLARIR